MRFFSPPEKPTFSGRLSMSCTTPSRFAASRTFFMKSGVCNSFSPRERACVVLRYYEDLPETEIAQIIGCRPGTVKSLLDRATKKLRKELQP